METTQEIERHLTANMSISKKDIILGNLLGGIAWGVGSVIGASVVVAIIGYILKALGVFTAISEFLQITNLPGNI